jgi:hypothetical protein
MVEYFRETEWNDLWKNDAHPAAEMLADRCINIDHYIEKKPLPFRVICKPEYTVHQLFGHTEYCAVDEQNDILVVTWADNRHVGVNREKLEFYGRHIKPEKEAFENRKAAAMKIQACFRGWKIKMRIRFCPHNSFGRFLMLRMYYKFA